MIAENMIDRQQNWQHLLSNGVSEPQELLRILQLDPTLASHAEMAAGRFAMRVPRGFIDRMEVGNLHDPLLRQVLPLAVETEDIVNYSHDPVGDRAATVMPGLLHKFHGRVLLTIAGVCAINCRYCFRREFPYRENNPGRAGWQSVLDHIQKDKTITEVIFSGGDPMMLVDDRLIELANSVIAVHHVKRLRIHTRLPIVLPERITKQFVNWITATTKPIVMVLHCNHANEIDLSVENAMSKLRDSQVTLLNQSVFLRGVNDSVESIIHLSEALFSTGVMPYYLHLLDKVSGAAHFDVPEKEAKGIMREVANKLPGYLVPKLVREVAGEGAKKVLAY